MDRSLNYTKEKVSKEDLIDGIKAINTAGWAGISSTKYNRILSFIDGIKHLNKPVCKIIEETGYLKNVKL